ncbi:MULTISPECIES: hypothetical protein [Achromobacter]|jgi:hypothetical protein|uniref:Uncharacterized protein n=2 Tax=Achromobacter TaxID=222 RepID=A0A2M9H1R0_9BURK|nr:hypothetical protein [Achromobacter ruhlandii]AKP92388.1 hypothetical protein Axylo_4938 [Achromobacter xylosoxidans]MCI1837376.1 hypothetical protein [Achromobacter ruhlandii]MCZ8396907.1 hypothetical protein [Achromobacter ruhlandii]MCZ8433210.1 hypothetical protein [Achromobacter ruhlandii]MDC6088577.1 hypothetical protein [Achromobacter ruhlandii]
MKPSAPWFLSCLLLAGAAHAGSAPAELSCVSESGKVALRGTIPSPSSEELSLTLTYGNAKQAFDSGDDPAYVVSDFPLGVFTLVAPDDTWPLTLYALPATVAVKKVANGDIAGTFQAKLTGPRPGGTTASGMGNPLTAILNCDYRYSL